MPPASSYNERELLEQIALGNEKAFAKVFEEHRQQLYVYLLRITKSGHVAEDILADIFMKLWLGRELAIHIESLEGFLHKIAYNKAMDFFTTVARHTRLQKVYAERLVAETERPSDYRVIDNECRQMLLDAVNQLPPQRKLIYTLSREHGLTHEQIAQSLNLSRSTVKNTIMAATRSISEHLQKRYAGKTALSCLFFL